MAKPRPGRWRPNATEAGFCQTRRLPSVALFHVWISDISLSFHVTSRRLIMKKPTTILFALSFLLVLWANGKTGSSQIAKAPAGNIPE